MLDASSKTWATRYHPVYIPMPRWYGNEEYTGFCLPKHRKKIPLFKKSQFFQNNGIYLIFWIKVIPFPLSLAAESPYTRNRRSKHPMLFATLCPLLILTTTPLFGNSSV